MDFTAFFYSIGFFLMAYLMHFFFIKNEKVSSEENGWEGMSQLGYINLWGCVIAGIVGGTISFLMFLLQLPHQ